MSFVLSCYADHRYLHSFPTRRSSDLRERILALEMMARQCDEMVEMDFRFLFDAGRELFSIGYNVSDGRRDASFYDLDRKSKRLKLQSPMYLVCRLLLEKKKKKK